MIIDTHTHIYTKKFDKDRCEVIQNAKKEGIEHLILPNIDEESLPSMLSLENDNPSFFHAAIGLHPTSVTSNNSTVQLDFVEKELDRRSYCAIGEIGIDLYWDDKLRNNQIFIFEQQLFWAKERNIPVLIHSRNAFRETINSIKKSNINCGIFHSFGGSLSEAEEILSCGKFKLGINGIVTFKNSNLSETLKLIPLDYIVLETDAPYLAPAPLRGKRNEPAYIKHIINKLSDIYKLSSEEIAKKTTENSLEILKILPLPTQKEDNI